MSGLSNARGKTVDVDTAATTEEIVIVDKMGALLGGGFSVFISGTGRGVVKIYYKKPDGTRVEDPLMEGTKASALLVFNYSGFVPEYEITVTPDAVTPYSWTIESCSAA